MGSAWQKFNTSSTFVLLLTTGVWVAVETVRAGFGPDQTGDDIAKRFIEPV